MESIVCRQLVILLLFVGSISIYPASHPSRLPFNHGDTRLFSFIIHQGNSFTERL
ncbi:hypothetical protein Mapa_016260 [Marchantia paleacea]|nr:hypothetical protein Mapa_016260 [Marchantia paleacea]